MRTDEILTLFEFNVWANHKVLQATEQLAVEQFTNELGSSFSSVRDTLAHVAGVEWVWLERLQGRSPAAIPDAKQFPDVVSLRLWWQDIETAWLNYLRNINQEELEQMVDYKTLSFGAGRNPRWQMIQHVANHGTYHRGQVATMMRQLGSKSASTDLITFYRERTAAAGA